MISDIDDTVLALSALVLFGQRSAASTAEILCGFVEPWAIDSLCARDDGWVRPGVFRTWFTNDLTDNPVDLCVNANVALLYVICGNTKSRCFLAVCEMLNEVISAGGVNHRDMGHYCPYYAHPIELLYAVRRACKSGGRELEACLTELESRPWAGEDITSDWRRDRPICGDASGPPFWISPGLQAVRQLKSRFPD